MKIIYFIFALFLYLSYYSLGSYILNYNTSNYISNGDIISHLKYKNNSEGLYLTIKKSIEKIYYSRLI